MIAVYVIVAIVVILLIAFIVIYNRLVNVHNQMRNAWAQVDVQLKLRHDLIPNLVETVKGYMQHERQTLEAVTKARNVAKGTAVGRAAIGNDAVGVSARFTPPILVVVENY